MPRWFLAKKLAFKDPQSLKFHNRTDINVYTVMFQNEWSLTKGQIKYDKGQKGQIGMW